MNPLPGKIVRMIAGCLLIQLFISWKAWLPVHREFPLVPFIAGWAVRWGILLNCIFFFGMIGSCAVLLVRPFSRKAILTLLACFVLMVLEDSTRLQPWFWLYGWMLTAFIFFEKKEEQLLLFIPKLILSSVYFWSGLQKVNVHFAVEMFPWLCEFTGGRSYVEGNHWIALAVGCIESVSGVCLWIMPLRRLSAFIILGTHLFILLSLGPTGHNWNHVVWPWNIAFAWMVWRLFIPACRTGRRESGNSVPVNAMTVRNKMYVSVVVLFVTLLPALNLAGKWDHFLSGSYYSSIVSSGVIVLPPEAANTLPPSSKEFQFYSKKENKLILLIDAWALDELKVPVYPEDRTHIMLSKEIGALLHHIPGCGLRLFLKARFDPQTLTFNVPL
jgi:hypothetical protein